jgi:Fe-S-cluster containining protein
MPPDAPLPTSRVRVSFSANGRPFRIEVRAPGGRARLDQLLPALREIDDQLIEATVARHEATGKRISCAKGCSACCRVQPVPVTPPEAFALAQLVDALPEPRRTAVRSASAAAVERLHEAGLYMVYMRRDPEMTRAAAMAVARRYATLSLACPFLLDDACSIYAERPFVCRQYLVTSAPELCKAPLDNPVRPIKAPAAFATAMLQVAEQLLGPPQYTVPLILALEYAREHRDTLERTFEARSAFGQVMEDLHAGASEVHD